MQRKEWFKFLMRFRNDALMIFSIICLQLPFELAYAHLYELAQSGIIRYKCIFASICILKICILENRYSIINLVQGVYLGISLTKNNRLFRFGLTGLYLLAIQYFPGIGGKISVGLIKHESTENKEYQANSLVYKVAKLSPWAHDMIIIHRSSSKLTFPYWFSFCRCLDFTLCSRTLDFFIMPSSTVISTPSVKCC